MRLGYLVERVAGFHFVFTRGLAVSGDTIFQGFRVHNQFLTRFHAVGYRQAVQLPQLGHRAAVAFGNGVQRFAGLHNMPACGGGRGLGFRGDTIFGNLVFRLAAHHQFLSQPQPSIFGKSVPLAQGRHGNAVLARNRKQGFPSLHLVGFQENEFLGFRLAADRVVCYQH